MAGDRGSIEVRPATVFDDVATMLGPKRSPDATVCWCLSHRVDSRTNRSLAGRERAAYVRDLVAAPVPPGVLAYDGDEVCGWAGVAPRAELPVARSTRIAAYDDQPVWNVFCVRVRPGFRGRGVSAALIEGAVELARAHGAPAVEAVPVDNRGAKVDLTMAFVGTLAMFERAGFTQVAETRSVSAGFPRVVVRRAL
ncbi:GNAT family N-acetyltransferase [Nocardioides anomalus]|uniref:GNAT family N-acetyltransferase n=1 Tax=Nocardioides anomalus TaxID=2712223 RepID=A0A6G6WA16_9ACTN|nr:GNAT family N-acetyltransferase [Nocardioides anomalus]QIG41880.1 GNAT family N-acetyltransferase [Nocardioides anomalus]